MTSRNVPVPDPEGRAAAALRVVNALVPYFVDPDAPVSGTDLVDEVSQLLHNEGFLPAQPASKAPRARRTRTRAQRR
jgi:hypothetical protein